ncbi:MAG: PAS domain S-box protein [Desulfobacteraceae bacterium]|nr:MAG: PAS domain S-box protein [Desulfobacteraceae bacterium]
MRDYSFLGTNNNLMNTPTYDKLVTRIRELEEELCLNKRVLRQHEISEKTYQLMFNQTVIGVAICDSKTCEFKKVNRKYSEIVGYTINELSQLSFLEITHPEDLEKDLHNFQLLLKSEIDSYSIEKRYFRKDGSVVWGKITVWPMWRKDEDPSFHMAILEDITEQKQAQEENAESEERYRSIMEASPDPIVTYDMKGNAIYINPAFTCVFGWSHDEVIGRKVDYVPEEARQETQGMIKKLKRGEGYLSFKTKRYDKNRNLIDIDMSFNVWKDKSGKPAGSVVILRDVTEQNKVLSQLQKAQKLEAIGTLAGGIAHDFNNILSGIFGYSQLAEMHLNTPQKARKDIEQIQKAGQKAADLIQQILAISRKSEPKKDPLLIHVIINEAVKLLRATIPTTIEINEDLQSQACVLADATKIHQVIMNLGTNAYHAMMENGGVLSVSLKEFCLSNKEDIPDLGLKPGRYLRLEVSDTGCGMDSKTVKKIFDPYFTTKEHGKGTGLGLAVAYGIIEEHKGTIKVFSEPDQGTTFQVYLPIIEKKGMDNFINVKDDQPLTGSENILLIDDDETVLNATEGILNELGYKVYPFKNGNDAFEAYKLNPQLFDLIITDLTMPGMNGFEVSQKILELFPGQPVVLCTGLGESIIREKAHSIGIVNYVEKPMITWKVAKTIRSILD